MKKDPKSQREAAALLGVSRSTFRDWLARPDFPPKREGGAWSADELRAFAAARRPAEDADRPEPGDLPDYFRERARKMRVDADRAEHELALRRGELVATVEVERTWALKTGELFAEIDRAFCRCAPKLSGLDAPAILKELRAMIRATRERSAV